MIVRVLALLMLLMPLASPRAEGFLTGTDDLPLMDGLAEVAGSTTVFDQPAGRFIEGYATGRVAAEDVAVFYQETLPHLGWAVAGPLTFTREGERLSIVLTPGGADLTVRFSLAPE